MNSNCRHIARSTWLLVLCALVGITAHQTKAAESTVPAAPPTSAPAQPPVQPQNPTNNVNWPSSFGRSSLPAFESSRDPIFELKEIRRKWAEIFNDDAKGPIFLPPIPPALAERKASAFRQVPKDYPTGLIELVGETFYMPYGTLYYTKALSPKRIARVEAYRASRDQLAAALRATLERSKGLASAERQRIRLELANQQHGALEALEAEAESIRRDLTESRVFRNSDDGSDLIRSAEALDRHTTAIDPKFVYPLVAAQYHDGFSVEQRMLLQEIAIEQRLATRKSTPGEAEDQTSNYIFFSPATARIRLPVKLATETIDALHRFDEQKKALKAELLAAMERGNFIFLSGRARNYAQLAKMQAPAFMALNTLSEEIRTELSRIPYPDAPSKSDLAPDLTRRIGSALRQKAELQRELGGRFKTVRDALPKERVEIVRKGKALAVRVVESGDVRANKEQLVKLLADLNTFNRDLELRYLALADEMDALRHEIQAKADERAGNPMQGVDQLITDFARSYTTQENWKRFADYYSAVLEPGLSPEQRRLLYKIALVDIYRAEMKPSS
jgi:hypothetical protein